MPGTRPPLRLPVVLPERQVVMETTDDASIPGEPGAVSVVR